MIARLIVPINHTRRPLRPYSGRAVQCQPLYICTALVLKPTEALFENTHSEFSLRKIYIWYQSFDRHFNRLSNASFPTRMMTYAIYLLCIGRPSGIVKLFPCMACLLVCFLLVDSAQNRHNSSREACVFFTYGLFRTCNINCSTDVIQLNYFIHDSYLTMQLQYNGMIEYCRQLILTIHPEVSECLYSNSVCFFHCRSCLPAYAVEKRGLCEFSAGLAA